MNLDCTHRVGGPIASLFPQEGSSKFIGVPRTYQELRDTVFHAIHAPVDEHGTTFLHPGTESQYVSIMASDKCVRFAISFPEGLTIR